MGCHESRGRGFRRMVQDLFLVMGACVTWALITSVLECIIFGVGIFYREYTVRNGNLQPPFESFAVVLAWGLLFSMAISIFLTRWLLKRYS